VNTHTHRLTPHAGQPPGHYFERNAGMLGHALHAPGTATHRLIHRSHIPYVAGLYPRHPVKAMRNLAKPRDTMRYGENSILESEFSVLLLGRKGYGTLTPFPPLSQVSAHGGESAEG
jgi:hypothetical protein